MLVHKIKNSDVNYWSDVLIANLNSFQKSISGKKKAPKHPFFTVIFWNVHFKHKLIPTQSNFMGAGDLGNTK